MYTRPMAEIIAPHLHIPAECDALSRWDYWRQDWRPGRELTTVQARAWVHVDIAEEGDGLSLHAPDADDLLAEHIHEEATDGIPGTREEPGRYGDGIEWRDEVGSVDLGQLDYPDRPTPEHVRRILDALGGPVTVCHQGRFWLNGARPDADTLAWLDEHRPPDTDRSEWSRTDRLTR